MGQAAKRRLRMRQQIALHQIHAEFCHHRQFRGGLDAFGHRHETFATAELDQVLHQAPRASFAFDTAHQVHVELHDVRLELRQQVQAGVAGAQVVECDAKPALAQCGDARACAGVVTDGFGLGDFEHDARRPTRQRRFVVEQLIVAQVTNALLNIILATLVITDRVQPWHVYVTAFLMACVQVFLQPSRAAMISDTVPAKTLTNAIGLNAVVFNMARSTGPALSGLLISIFGTGISYSVQAVFFLLATVWTMQMSTSRYNSPLADRETPRESFGQSIIEGWKFSWRKLEVRSGILVVIIAALFMIPFSTLLPVFARDLLQVGARGQGLLLTAMGVGALGSSLMIASIGDRMPRGLLMIGGVALYGVLVMIFSFSPWFSFSMALMAIIGICHVSSHALVQTVIQTYSPPEFRGRTIAVFHMTQVLLLLGGLLVGALSALMGAPLAAASMSMIGTLCMIMLYIAAPKAREIR